MLEIGEAKSVFVVVIVKKNTSTKTRYSSAIYWSNLTLLPQRQSALLLLFHKIVKLPLTSTMELFASFSKHEKWELIALIKFAALPEIARKPYTWASIGYYRHPRYA